jgi:hypothetical protein
MKENINRIKDKNHMIISCNADKDLEKIHCSFLIKVLKKLGLEIM